jgi:hypothetical protein
MKLLYEFGDADGDCEEKYPTGMGDDGMVECDDEEEDVR